MTDEGIALHDDRAKEGPDDWWACFFPERPGEPDRTLYDRRCPKCLLKKQIDLRTVQDVGIRSVRELNDGTPVPMVKND